MQQVVLLNVKQMRCSRKFIRAAANPVKITNVPAIMLAV
jgi:hypothetical protein